MALEDLTGSNKFISALVPANPLSADDRREGDDHIRGIKNVLRNSFPDLNGAVNFGAAAGPFLPLTGGILTGGLTIDVKAATVARLLLQNTDAAANYRSLYIQNDVPNRFASFGFTKDNLSGWQAGLYIDGATNKARDLLTNGAYLTEFGGEIKNYSASGGTHGLIFYPATDSSYPCVFYNAAKAQCGLIFCTATSTTYQTNSDYRLKRDVTDLEGGLDAVMALRPRRFRWNADNSAAVGFIAHELQGVIPEAVVGEKDAVNADGSIKPQGTDLSFVVPWLVRAVQELAARVAVLEARP